MKMNIKPFIVTPQKAPHDELAVIIDKRTADLIRAARRSMGQQRGPLHIYSDGSYIHQGSLDASMGFSSVFLNADGKCCPGVYGAAKNNPGSTTAELIGLASAIAICPRNRPAIIHCDSIGIVDQFSRITQHQGGQQPRIKSCAKWWKIIEKSYEKQGRLINVEWVQGHCGVEGNEAADLWATMAHTLGLTPWELSCDHKKTSSVIAKRHSEENYWNPEMIQTLAEEIRRAISNSQHTSSIEI